MPFPLIDLPPEILSAVCIHLTSKDLYNLACTCQYFTAQEKPASGLNRVQSAAKCKVLLVCGGDNKLAKRWRFATWIQRLHIEESACDFDWQAKEHGVIFSGDLIAGGSKPIYATEEIVLQHMGPKQVVSQLTTSDHHLRWRVRIEDNLAVAFGVVPPQLQTVHSALLKCLSVPKEPAFKATGAASIVCRGSDTPIKVTVVDGATLELLASRKSLYVLVHNPTSAAEQYFNAVGNLAERRYSGPEDISFALPLPENHAMKLCITLWAGGRLTVLHKAQLHKT